MFIMRTHNILTGGGGCSKLETSIVEYRTGHKADKLEEAKKKKVITTAHTNKIRFILPIRRLYKFEMS